MMIYLNLAVVLLIAVSSAIGTAKACASKWQGNFKKICLVTGLVTVLSTAISVLFDGPGLSSIKTILLCCTFCFASYGDIKTHTAEDYIHVLVLAISLIGKDVNALPSNILTALILGGLMLIVAIFIGGAGIGGADIKFVAACSFLSNMLGCFFGFGLGLFIALLFNSPLLKKKGAANAFPMLPYLSCGYMLVHLLSV